MSDTRSLNLEQQRKLPKDLLKAARAGDAAAVARIGKTSELNLATAQKAIAGEAGFESWPKLVKSFEQSELERAAKALHTGDAKALRRILRGSPALKKRIN